MVKITESPSQLSDQITHLREQGHTIGFVPTMGALHQGHMHLIETARQANDVLVVSIFVNPAQFNDPDDYRNYPRTRDADVQQLEQAGCDLLFMPDEKAMYPDGPEQLSGFDPGLPARVLEGHFRPGHFEGVATIVKKLFDCVQPERAYFGLKDYQQFLVIRHLVEYYQMGIAVVPVPTIRENDGLAISSRNVLLTSEQRSTAPVLYQTLQWAKEQLLEQVPVAEVRKLAFQHLSYYGEPEYFEICDAYTFEAVLKPVKTAGLVICTAVQLGKVRLIDNILLSRDELPASGAS